MANQIDLTNPIENTYIFDISMSTRGARLNKLAESLKRAENREAFKADTESYMQKFLLSEAEQRLIKDEDWLNLIKAGTNIYNAIRIDFVNIALVYEVYEPVEFLFFDIITRYKPIAISHLLQKAT